MMGITSGRTIKVEIFVLTEGTVARFLTLCLLRAGDPVVAGIDPAVSLLKRPLAVFAAWAIRNGRARDISTVDPLWARFDRTPSAREGSATYTDIFKRIEPAFNQVQDSTGVAAALGPDYALPALNVLFAGLQPLGYLLLMLDDLAAGLVTLPPQTRFHGLRPELVTMHERMSGHRLSVADNGGRRSYRVINTAWLLLLALYGIGWLIRRLRPARPPERITVAIDLIDTGRGLELAQAFIDQPKETLMIMRNKGMLRDFAAALAVRGYRSALATSGTVPPSALLAAVGDLLGDLWRLYSTLGGYHPRLCFAAMALAVRRQYYRALFRRFAVRAFWCRDDYNPDHIVRSQELRRIGARSFGIQHGLTTHCRVHPNWRYIDYDHYFTYGTFFYDTVWKQTWAPHMYVQPVGSWILTPELAALDHSRGRDIAVLTALDLTRPAFSNAIRVLAERFPERRVIVCQKPYEDDGYFQQHLADLPNIHWAASYPTMGDPAVRYAVCGISTIAAEAVHFGLDTIVLDLSSDLPSPCDNVYAVFPDLCFFSAEAVVDRIAALDDGIARFERELYTGLINWQCRDPRGAIAAAIRRQVHPCA